MGKRKFKLDDAVTPKARLRSVRHILSLWHAEQNKPGRITAVLRRCYQVMSDGRLLGYFTAQQLDKWDKEPNRC